MSLIFMDLVENIESRWKHRARICKRLRSLGIDSKESIPPAYVAWRDGTKLLHRLGRNRPGLQKRLKIRALESRTEDVGKG
jgi:hypothetical protein